MRNAIEFNKVHFAYKKQDPILKDLSFQVPKGSIYGFLGANGAGKTTSLKLLLSLLKWKNGSIKVLGETIHPSDPSYLAHIGSLIEDSSLYQHLSARDNLRIWCKYHHLPSKRIDEVLELVGLKDAQKKKTRNFSTGMKQRLGLGIALLHDPGILILDEPTNGLDPMGISDLRTTLFNMRDLGKTILLSSHILSEVEKVVDTVGILKDGSIAFEGSLLALKEQMKRNSRVLVRVNDPIKAIHLLSDTFEFKLQEDVIYLQVEEETEIAAIIKQLVEAEIQVFEVFQDKKDLEQFFFKSHEV